jgi:hypothetical protein
MTATKRQRRKREDDGKKKNRGGLRRETEETGEKEGKPPSLPPPPSTTSDGHDCVSPLQVTSSPPLPLVYVLFPFFYLHAERDSRSAAKEIIR